MATPLAPQDPTRIGPYTVDGRLGSGGMGAVYLGRGPDGRACAIKVVHPGLAREQEFRARFAQEVAAARRVHGPHLARVLDADPDAAVPWLATEHVDGPSLDDAVAAGGPLAEPDVRGMAGALFGALAVVHAAGVVHRDVKPTNVLLGPAGAVLIDFGIAHAAESTRITRTGMVIGAPGFMSPEQASGDEVGPASDVFSLAAVLLFAATGAGPFGTGSPAALLLRAADTPPRLDDLPEGLRPLLAPCLARDPATRPSADDVARVLTPGLPPTRPSPPATALAAPPRPHGGGRPVEQVAPRGPRRGWWLIASAATAAVAVILVVVLVVTTNAAPEPPAPPAGPAPLVAVSLTVPGGAADVAYSPDGRRVYVAHDQGVGVIDTASRVVTTTVRTVVGASAVTASPDGSRILVGLRNGSVQILDSATFRAVGEVRVRAYVNRLVVDPDTSLVTALTSASAPTPTGSATTQALAVIDPVTSRVVGTPLTGLRGIVNLEPSGDGRTLFVTESALDTADRSSTVTVLGASDMSVRSRTPLGSSRIPEMASAPGDAVYLSDGRGPTLVRLGSDGRTTGLPVAEESPSSDAVAGTRDGRSLYVLRDGRRIELVDVADGRITAIGYLGEYVAQTALRASPDGRQVVLRGTTDSVRIFTLP